MVQTKASVTTVYHCSLERAFKSPILCDISKIHTGYAMVPRVTHCTEDKGWGKPGSSKKVFVAKSFSQRGGFAAIDKVIERIENNYWKIEISDLQFSMLGFYKLVGEWQTTKLDKDKIYIEYSYTLYSNHALLYPVYWLFTIFFWKRYMKSVLENIRLLILNKEPYQHE